MQYLGIEEVAKVLRAAYKENRAHHLMLLLSFSHGLRRSEVAALRVRDVQDGRICVSRVKGSLRTEQPLMASDNLLFDEPKSLAAWLDERVGDSDALFPSRKGHGTLKPDSVGKIAVHYMEKANVPEKLAHHHSLRHACCSLLARAGVGIEYIAQYAGHKDIKNTRIYLHISDNEASATAFAVFKSLPNKGRDSK